MRKNVFLTSAIAVLFAMPAFAEIVSDATCNIENLGQSENGSTANVEAMWAPNRYSEPAGQYLLYDSQNDVITQHQTCLSGSYCGGFSDLPFADSSMGIESCPVEYANSAAGSDEINDCYNPETAVCSTRNPYTGGHATAVIYGNSTNGNATCKTFYGDTTTCVLDTADACDITALTCETGYHKTGGNPITLEAGTAIAYSNQNYPTNFGYKSNSGTGTNSNDTGLQNGEWFADWSEHITVHGRASCNSTAPSNWQEVQSAQGDEYKTKLLSTAQPSNTFNTTSTGQNCWCNLKSYQLSNAQSPVDISSSWIFMAHSGDDANECANSCAFNCAFAMMISPYFKQALWQTVESTELQCVANTININWYNQDDLHDQNYCTYDDTITLPAENPTRPGYIFKGWRIKPCTSYDSVETCPTNRCSWNSESNTCVDMNASGTGGMDEELVPMDD